MVFVIGIVVDHGLEVVVVTSDGAGWDPHHHRVVVGVPEDREDCRTPLLRDQSAS